ncbi:MAG: hypothetical protein VX899_02600 [Myxococcota bacterium]|nr:hypothetical protein [Myxococcota bacterium]
MWLLLPALAAAGVEVIAPSPLEQGRPGRVLVSSWSEDQPAEAPPELALAGGELLALQPEGHPGVWELVVLPDATRPDLVVRVDGTGHSLALKAPSRPDFSAPTRLEGEVTEGIMLELSGELTPPDIQVLLPKDLTLSAVEDTGSGLRLSLDPGPSQEARVLLVGLRDLRKPQSATHWVQLRLHRIAQVKLATEPGSKVSIRVGGRTVGPVAADRDGKVAVDVPVYPGETEAVAVSEDPAGNRSETRISLAISPPPALGIAAVEGAGQTPHVEISAQGPAGRAWTGAAPECLIPPGVELDLRPVAPGRWTAWIPGVERLPPDLRVSCTLGKVQAQLQHVGGAGGPERVVLRAWPEELSSDFPVAQLQASLEDSRGDRLPLAGLELSAQHGAVEHLVMDGRVLRADYMGDGGNPQDQVVARWVQPPSSEPVVALELSLSRRGQGREAVVRAFDAQGAPVQGAQISLRVDEYVLQAQSDARGRARLYFEPQGVQVVVVSTQGVEKQGLSLPWLEYPVIGELGPDLQTQVPLNVRAGRVRRAELSMDQEVLYTQRGAAANVVVVLLDRDGVPVPDEPVRLSASEGFLSSLQPLPDGSLRAVYQPPPQLRAGKVQIRLEALDSSFEPQEFTLVLAPPPIYRAPGLTVGGVLNFNGPLGPYLGLSFEQALRPPIPFALRAELGVYRVDRNVNLSSGSAALRMEVVPLVLSGHRRWDQGLWSTWVGAGLVVAPFRSRSWFVEDGLEEPGTSQLGIHPPGLQVYAGRGYRLRGGESFAEIRYTALGSSAEEFSGQIGGVTATIGFRIVY